MNLKKFKEKKDKKITLMDDNCKIFQTKKKKKNLILFIYSMTRKKKDYTQLDIHFDIWIYKMNKPKDFFFQLHIRYEVDTQEKNI